MIELLLCSLVTIFPDYLVRRFAQGKRIGQEITLYSVWYELRWGITACLVLTVTLITVIFYYHPATSYAVSYFRTIPVVPEGSGRVAEIYVGLRDRVKAGQPLFRLDSAVQEASLETARRRAAEIDTQVAMARSDLAAAGGRIQEAESAWRQARDEYETKAELFARNSGAVPEREVERLRIAIDARQGALSAATAAKDTIETQITVLLPAQKASALAAVTQAEAEVAKSVVLAGVDGTLEQFTLRPGDVVNPFMRPAGILVPADAGRTAIVAGFGQIEAQVIRPGLAGAAARISRPLTIIPLVVTEVQEIIAAGQLRPTDVLLDPQQTARPGTLTVYLEPLYKGALDSVPPGSSCIVNVYSNNYDRLAGEDVGTGEWLFLHMIDAVGVVHAAILRIQSLMMPVQTLVLSGY